MIDLERALTDLAEHLDHPVGEHSAETLRLRLTAETVGGGRRRPARALLVAAAVCALVCAGVVAVPPARHAVADWLGIGAVEVRRSERPPSTSASTARTVPGARGSAPSTTVAPDLTAARKAVRFRIATPRDAGAGPLTGVAVDRRVPGGLVSLTYTRFTLVEIATDPVQPPPLGKLVGGTAPVVSVRVNGRPGLWIPAPHEIGYFDRAGRFETDTVRRSGPALLWERAGVTYRIEGLRTKARALAVATSMH